MLLESLFDLDGDLFVLEEGAKRVTRQDSFTSGQRI